MMTSSSSPARPRALDRRRRRRLATVVMAAALVLAGCGGDADEAEDVAGEVASDLASAAEEAASELDEAVEQAEDVLEDAGVDPDAGGSAELVFQGTTYELTAAEQFGCFITEEGGSQGAVSFEGTAEDGTELTIDWAGDSPDSAMISVTTPDGAEWFIMGSEVDVTVSGTSAVVSGTVRSVADGTTADVVARPTCG